MSAHLPTASLALPIACGPLTGLKSSSESVHRFLVGTCSTETYNEVHIVEYDDQGHSLRDACTLRHSDAEITGITTCPAFSDRYFTCHYDAASDCGGATLWQLPDPSTFSTTDLVSVAPTALVTLRIPTAPPKPPVPATVTPLPASACAPGGAPTVFGATVDPAAAGFVLPSAYTAPTPAGPRGAVVWSRTEASGALGSSGSGSGSGSGVSSTGGASGSGSGTAAGAGKCLTRHAYHVYLWDIDRGDSEVGHSAVTSTQLTAPLTGLCWDPHREGDVFYTTGGRALRSWDTRTMREASVIGHAHAGVVTTLDANPNRPHTVLTAGTDGHYRVWDARRPLQPLLTVNASASGIAAARYNPSLDQLVLTAAEDSTVALWSALSVSSVPIEASVAAAAAAEGNGGDRALAHYADHEDVVQGLAWSESSAWVFSSVSVDGCLLIGTVPSSEKYKMLL